MRTIMVVGLAAVLAGALGAGRVAANDKAGAAAAGPLAPYFEIRQALAADDFGKVSEHAHHLAMAATMAARSEKPPVAKALAALAHPAHALGALGDKAGAKAVRQAFGDVSRAALAYAKAAKAAGVLKTPVHVFHCPMAKPYGNWLQQDGKIGNPYYGKSMLRCGSEVESLEASGGVSDAPKDAGAPKASGSSCCGGCGS